MVKVLVLFYSTYGHIYQMAKEIAEGAKEVEGSEVSIKRVPETLSIEILEKMGAFQAQQSLVDIPIATTNELKDYDVIIFGTPTRFGQMSAQMKLFLDSLGQLWLSNALVGKVASVFVSSGTQHGGQESTILNFIPSLLHLGFLYVGLPYSCQEQMGIDELKGGSPYGSSTIVGDRGERLPSEQEKRMARFQGRHATSIGKKLIAKESNTGVVTTTANFTNNNNGVTTSTNATVDSKVTNNLEEKEKKQVLRQEENKEEKATTLLLENKVVESGSSNSNVVVESSSNNGTVTAVVDNNETESFNENKKKKKKEKNGKDKKHCYLM
ncbi:hypothetical protein ABK040_003812 [Willaertia magna]